MSQRKPGKGMPFPSDFIALGSKVGTAAAAAKREREREREAAAAGAQTGSTGTSGYKKSSAAGSSALKASAGGKPLSASPSMSSAPEWEAEAIDIVDISDFPRAVSDADEEGDTDKVNGLLCGAVKLLRGQRAKPDQLLYLSLMFLAKSKSEFFANESVLQAFCSLLKRDVKESYKSKGNALVSVLAANVLMAAFQKEKAWPELFVRVFIDDSMGERLWVDHPDCRGFVDNIITAFGTKMPTATQSLYPKPGGDSGREQCGSPPVSSGAGGGGGSGSGSGSATPTRPNDDDQAMETGIPLHLEGKHLLDVTVSPRFQGMQSNIEHLVLEIIREQLSRRQGTDNITRSFLKFLITACGLPEVRLTVISKIEMWVMNPKVSRVAHDLLLTVAINSNTHTPVDVDVIVHFTKLRFKNKPMTNLYVQCAREICLAHPENLPSIVKHVIFNELSNARNPNNMAMLNVIFSTDGERAAASLASVFLELLLQKDCYLRALRALLREIVRALRHEINLQAFCLTLMQERPKEHLFRDFEFKERMFINITDLVTLAMYVGLSPSVREALVAHTRGDRKDMTPLRKFLNQLAWIHRDAMWWFHDVVPRMYKPPAQLFSKCLYKVLFLASLEEYFSVDGWPAESDRGLYYKATLEIPLLQDTMMQIFMMGLSRSIQFTARDTVTLAEMLVKRAGSLHTSLSSPDFAPLKCDKPAEIFDMLFKLTAYSYPDSIALPKDYTPPSMAIASAYWMAWIVLLFYVAHNPIDFGRLAWESYPTLRAFMEMCITNQFVFPPPTTALGEAADIIRSKEMQTAAVEKTAILTFEQHLADACNKETIGESNSLLLTSLISMDPNGPLRRPPPQILQTLQEYNAHYKIGHLLCRSRNPDFLLDILQRQGTNQAMPWLADLVESSDGSFNLLPVQCLCEFLLDSSAAIAAASNVFLADDELKALEVKKRKQKELLRHLQDLLQRPDSDKQACCETLDYFLRRLSSQQTQQRLQALRGLQMVLIPISNDVDMEDPSCAKSPSPNPTDNKWLLEHLPSLPCFVDFYPHISTALRSACQVENDPNAVGWYIQFLCHYAPKGLRDLAELCADMATTIVERSTILPAMLPGSLCKSHNSSDTFYALLRLFTSFLRRMTDPQERERSVVWTPDHQEDVISVVFEERQAFLHFFVVHAQIILLTFKPMDNKCREYYHEMLSLWFPSSGIMPRAYLLSSNLQQQEEAVLIPDWLKLKMIRSDEMTLVNAALRDLEPHQLVLFIQSFGIPVPSMSKLLQALDSAVQTDLPGVTEAVMDKNYMGQLVAVQHRRGARGGERFAEALSLNLASHEKVSQAAAGLSSGVDEDIVAIGRLTQPVVPPRSTALIPPAQVKSTLLHIFDVGSPGRMTMKEKMDTFRTLQKFLTAEMVGTGPVTPMIDATVKALDQILKSDLKDLFVTALVHRGSFSCGLYRLVSSALMKPNLIDSATTQLLLQVTSSLRSHQRLACSTSPLLSLFSTFEKKLCKEEPMEQSVEIKPSTPTKRGAGGRGGRKGKTEDSEETVAYNFLKVSSAHDFERQFHKLVDDALRKKSTRPLVNAMSKMLLEEENLQPATKTEPSESKKIKLERADSTNGHAVVVKNNVKAKAGLLVDWLESLDPEMVQVSDELQQKLLFSKTILRLSNNNNSNGASAASNRERTSQPYLLTMLTHQASWTSLRKTVDSVLTSYNPSFDGSAVLDFLSACIDIPKLWHGRAKHQPKHETTQDVLALDVKQLLVVVDYMLLESAEASQASQPFAETLQNRIPLLMRCLSSDRHKARAVVDYLIDKIMDHEDDENGEDEDEENKKRKKKHMIKIGKEVVQELLLQIYMKIPSCLVHLTADGSNCALLLPGKVASQGNTSVVDCISHTLLSALSATQHGRNWGVQMQEFDSAARKVASCHPLLMLRNLTLIAASLKGRTEYDFSFFRSRNHMTLYSILLGIMELLKPYIFRSEYAESLDAALKCYFEMLSAYFNRRDSMYGLIDRFVSFLHDYLNHQPQRAVALIVKEGRMLPDLQKAMASIQSLKQLVACVNFGPATGAASSASSSGTIGTSSYVAQTRRDAAKEAVHFRNSLSAAVADEELAAILIELNGVAIPKPQILEHVVDEICSLIGHPCRDVRVQAYNLMLKYLRHTPKDSGDILAAYVSCLESGDPSVVLTALEKLPDVSVLAQEQLGSIMHTVFCLGLYSNLNVSHYLTETINVMNVQAGY